MLNNLLPLMQMMSGLNNKNVNMADMLKNMTGGGNNNMADMLKNMAGNTDNAGENPGGNSNMADMLKNMTGGGGNNLLNMLPLMQMMMSKPKNTQSRSSEAGPEIENVNDKKFYYLKPISKIANKDITYVLNQYFAQN